MEEFKVFLLLSLFIEPRLVFGSNGCNFPAVFNFGDSNSDTGGLTAAFGDHLLPPPYGSTFFRESTGRFSDGRATIDFMAESLGLPYLSAFLDSIGSNFSHGANFATGGSTIMHQRLNFLVNGFSPFSLDVQLAQFSRLLTRSQIVRKQQEQILVFGSKECNFPAVFNFGDSNSDTGGLAAAFGDHLLPPPYGSTFFRESTGRFSDGRATIDFMAESLGLPYLSAFLDSIASNFSHGANFATGGSTIMPQRLSFSVNGFSPFSLDVQLAQFSRLLTRSQIVRKQQGFFEEVVPKEGHFSRALYTFDISQNDLTAAFAHNLTVEEVKSNVPRIVEHFSYVIKKLYNQGGRSFWIHNTGPLGCWTYFIDSLPDTETRFDEYGCFIPYNEASQYFNLKLKEAVLQLRKVLPEAAITYVDMYSVKYSLITQANKLGFEDPFLVCCGRGGKYNLDRSWSCGSNKPVAVDPFRVDQEGLHFIDQTNKWMYDQTTDQANESGSCSDPSVRINWDGVHLTEAAQKWIFDQIVDGSYSDPPVPLKFSCKRSTAE